MSVVTDMRNMTLQINSPIGGPSGAKKDNWISCKEKVKIAIYKNSARQMTQAIQYQDSEFSGVSFDKFIAEGNRVIDGNHRYIVTYCNIEGRRANMLLKEIEYGG
ncbi:MAG: hypothetical protein RR945_02790 [Erysipelotrichaceae bacterium]